MPTHSEPEAIVTETKRQYRLDSGVVIILIERERKLRNDELPMMPPGYPSRSPAGPRMTTISRSVAIESTKDSELDPIDTSVLLGIIQQWMMFQPVRARQALPPDIGMIGDI